MAERDRLAPASRLVVWRVHAGQLTVGWLRFWQQSPNHRE